LAARNVISANGGDGVLIQRSGDTGSDSNTIAGNFVGTDVTGNVGMDTNGVTLGNSGNGIQLQGATETIIGGFAMGSGNILSNNKISGIALVSSGQLDNTLIVGNLIRTASTGAKALGNLLNGINIGNSFNDIIGGSGSSGR